MILKEIRRKWKPRPKASHKGDFGRVFILAGSRGYTGAAYLASAAAARAGAGLVTLGVPESVYPVLARRHAEVMVRPFPDRKGAFASHSLKPALAFAKNRNVLAIGPGLSQEKETKKFVRSFLSKTKQPVVIDADGLNALKARDLKSCRGRAILTPHPGEFIKLFGGQLNTGSAVRKKRALEAAKKSGAVVVLKGYRTIVAAPDGKVFINKTGNPGMAKGGSGDALTGILAAFLAQKFSLWDAARFGVYIHGLAADDAVRIKGQISLLASDLLDSLPNILKRILRR